MIKLGLIWLAVLIIGGAWVGAGWEALLSAVGPLAVALGGGTIGASGLTAAVLALRAGRKSPAGFGLLIVGGFISWAAGSHLF